MKTLILGTGAVGGYYGLKLHQNGYDVTFGCRNSIFNKIKTEGLILESYSLNKPVIFNDIKLMDTTTDINEKFDLIVLCVKSYDTEKILPELEKYLNKKGMIISFQNGVENEKILLKHFKPDQVIGAVVFIAASLENFNVIKHTGAGKVQIGFVNPKFNSKLEDIKIMFEKSGIKFEVSRDIMKDLWTKLVWNASFNSVSVVLNAVVMDMINHESSRELLKKTMEEVIDAAGLSGIEINKNIIDDYLHPNANIGEFKTSMLQDFEKNKKLEYEYINGAVIRAASEKGLDVPYNHFLYNALDFYEKRIERSSIDV